MKADARCQKIELVLSDVDGVLTDGGVIFDNQGIEVKRFHIRDGLGIKLWQRASYRFGVVTARNSHIVKVRAAELGIDIIRQGFEHKLPTIREIMAQLELEPEQVCYIGDDLTDIYYAVQITNNVFRGYKHFVQGTGSYVRVAGNIVYDYGFDTGEAGILVGRVGSVDVGIRACLVCGVLGAWPWRRRVCHLGRLGCAPGVSL